MPTPIDLRGFKGRVRPTIDPARELPAPEGEGLLAAPERRQDEPITVADAFPGALFAWEAPEFDYRPENTTYITILGIFLIAGAVIAALFQSYIFAALLVLAGFLSLVAARRMPRMITIAITGRGIAAGRGHHDFSNLKSFWISYNPPLFKELILESKGTFTPTIRIPLGDADPVELRDVLVGFLKEERREETLVDILGKRIGF